MSTTKLNILSDEYNENPYFFIDRLDRSERILFDSTLNARVAICYQTVRELLGKKEIFSTEPLAARAEPVMRGKVLAQMQGDEHKMKRSLITRQITGSILHNYYRKYLQGLCEHIIAQLSTKPEFDFISDFGKEYSLLSTFHILGIDKDELTFYYDRLHLIVKFATGFNLNEDEKATYINAAVEMEESILHLIANKREQPGEDLLSFILSEGAKNESKRLDDSEIVALSLNVLLAASEPVDKVLSACIYHLYRHPSYLVGLISGDVQANDILQETLRITPSVHLIPRLAMDNYLTEHGDMIEKGELVFMLLPAANRDPKFFTEPDVFNPFRDFRGHLSYGCGIHTCIGAQFANLQLNIALTSLASLLIHYEEKSPPFFDGIYTRGATSYLLRRKNANV